jgi:hypothetical protein
MAENERAPAAWPKGMIGFFDAGILAVYQNGSDKYKLYTDYFEGSLNFRSDYYERLSESQRKASYVDVRFGFRRRTNGELAVAAWLPDLVEKCAEAEQSKWVGFRLKDNAFPKDPDPRFELWVRRYVHGDWDVENGVLYQISDEVANINAITDVLLGERLYEFHGNPALIFPMAENNHRYQDAHKEAYAFLVNGLRKEAIKLLGERLHVAGNFDNDKTLVALKRLLPAETHKRVLEPFEVLSTQRRLASHKVRPPAKPFPAFEEFSKDMVCVLKALKALKVFLEGVFKVSAQNCRTRQTEVASLPELDSGRKAEPSYSISKLPEVAGKTIERVEFGFRKSNPKLHESEAMILHFTDGSILGIETGSNAANVASAHEGLQPIDFHVDFLLTIAPPVK